MYQYRLTFKQFLRALRRPFNKSKSRRRELLKTCKWWDPFTASFPFVLDNYIVLHATRDLHQLRIGQVSENWIGSRAIELISDLKTPVIDTLASSWIRVLTSYSTLHQRAYPAYFFTLLRDISNSTRVTFSHLKIHKAYCYQIEIVTVRAMGCYNIPPDCLRCLQVYR